MVKKNKAGMILMDDPESARLLFEEMDMMDSPASATRRQNTSGGWKSCCGSQKNITGGGLYLPLHSQILRIRDEDSLVGQEICPGLSLFVADEYNNDDKASKVGLISRPILPASPLRGKAANHKFPH